MGEDIVDRIAMPLRRRGFDSPADQTNLGARPPETKGFNFRRTIGRNTFDGAPVGAIDARSLGAMPLESKRPFPIKRNENRTPSAVNQPVIDARSLNARVERPQGSTSFRNIRTGMDHQPAIDSRSLGARPEESKRSFPTRNIEARTSDGANPPVVDARSLGAGIDKAQRPLIRKQLVDSRLERQDSSGGSISQSRYPRGGDGDQSHSSIDTSTFRRPSIDGKNRSPQLPHGKDSARLTGVRADKTPQAYQIRSPRSRTNSKGSAMGGESRSVRPRRSRPGGPRAGRGSDDSEPQRRKRLEEKYDFSNINYIREGNWTAEERQYLEEKKERESESKAQVYEPENLSKKLFTGIAPATASDDLDLSEILGERLLLAKKYLDRGFIQWDSKEQKADVMAVVEKLKAVRRGGNPKGNVTKTESALPKSADGDQQAQSLMQKLIAGEYAAFRKLGETDILGHVERHVHRNDSFYPQDEKSLLEKVRSIMPAGRVPKVGGRARNEVKA